MNKRNEKIFTYFLFLNKIYNNIWNFPSLIQTDIVQQMQYFRLQIISFNPKSSGNLLDKLRS